MQRYFVIAIHDVSPATHAQCERLLELVQHALPGAPITWLIVPDYHGRARIDRAFEWRRSIDARVELGDELVLHGYWHIDEGPPSRSLTTLIGRHLLSDGEAEFAALDERAALARLHRGLAVFQSCGWRPAGFTPPAWQMSRATVRALRRTPLEYAATRTDLIALQSGVAVAAPALSLSTRSALRRSTSALWARSWLPANAARSAVRLALHPVDAAHPEMLRLWDQILRTCAQQRTPITKRALLQQLSSRPGAGGRAASHSYI